MYNTTEFHKRIKEAREKKGWTQAVLADKIGVSTQTISAYEKEGGKCPTLDRAAALAEALDVSIDYLCGADSSGNPSELEYYSDVLPYLERLHQFFDCGIGLRWIPLPPNQWVRLDDGDYVKDVVSASVSISDDKIARMFSDRNKLLAMCMNGTISREMYDTWIAGLREKYGKLQPVQRTGEVFYGYPNELGIDRDVREDSQ